MSEREIFIALLEIVDLNAREVYLERACHGDQELRNRVQTLLESHAFVGDFLERPIVCPNDIIVEDADTNESDISASKQVDQDLTLLDVHPVGFSLSQLASSNRPDSLGRLSHYEIVEVLGRGGFGTVLKAFDEKLQRLVAIKMMSPELGVTLSARQRFLREARSAAAIRHENVVAIHAVEEQPMPYLVMEFIPGKTLQELVDQSGPLPASEVAEIGKQIAQGLAAAHDRGLIHRDIKPSNILIETGTQYRVKIVDFGLARAVDDASLTQSGVVSGTPLYMSPEQAHGVQIDRRSDLFSLGSVLYLLASGRPPFYGATSLAVMQRVSQDQPSALDETIHRVPSWLNNAIMKLLSKNPDDRFQSSAELVEVLTEQEPNVLPASATRTRTALRNSLHFLSWTRSIFVAVLGLTIVLCVAALAYLGYLATRGDKAPNILATAETTAPMIANEPIEAFQARDLQTQWSSYLEVPLEYKNKIGMQFRLLPPGEFTMGTSQEEMERLLAQAKVENKPDWFLKNIEIEGPAHRVRLTRPLYVAIYETTVGNFREMVTEQQYKVDSIRDGKGGVTNGVEYRTDLTWERPRVDAIALSEDPVCQISWNDATYFCEWLSAREKRQYRLMSESEWEFACRAGTTTLTYIGDKLQADHGRIGSLSSVGVGSYPANSWGLYDMLGNVSEWCLDKIDNNYSSSAKVDPIYLSGVADQERVLRGGAFFEIAPRSAQRRGGKPSFRADTIGFRVALELEPWPRK